MPMKEDRASGLAQTPPRRVGFIVPSSNIVLEPVTSSMMEAVNGLSAHYARLRVTSISLTQAATAQFDYAAFVAAAELLADAKVDLIVWNGTAGSWLGLAYDRGLCDAIEQATGVPATTTTLAYHDLFARMRLKRIALVSPYTPVVQARIIDVWAAMGLTCVAERHLDIEDNFAFGVIAEDMVADMVGDVARSDCEAVVILCTNLLGARIAARCEREFGVLVLDSVAVTLEACLRRFGVDPCPPAAWGRLFDSETLSRRAGLDAQVAS